MKIKRLCEVFSALVLSISSFLALGFAPAVHAASGSDTCTWTGTTSSNFATATNWSGCSGAAPVNGDNLVFDESIISLSNVGSGFTWTLNNNISNLSVGTITFSNDNSSFYSYEIDGNGLTVSGGITNSSGSFNNLNIDLTFSANQTITLSDGGLTFGDESSATSHTFALGSHNLTMTGSADCTGVAIFSALTGSGNITDGFNLLSLSADSPSYSGNITVNTGTLNANSSQALGAASGGTTIAAGATLALGFASDVTFAEPLTISGNTTTPAIVTSDPGFSFGCSGGGGSNSTAHTATLSGAIALQTDAMVAGDQLHNLTITGDLSGNFALSVQSGSGMTLTNNSSNNTSKTPSGASGATATSTTVAAGDNQPSTPVDIGFKQTYIIDGTRGDVFVEDGGVLQGTGTVNSLSVDKGGIVAPGHSPGKLTVVTSLDLLPGSTYQAQLKDTADGDYDQLTVGSASDTTGHDVTLGDTTGAPTLSASLFDGFKINKGDVFTIINNLSKTSVDGTFANLPEGATFTVSGYVFKISYIGGDGNDVTLTVQTVPATPDTGFGLAAAHPGTTLLVTVMAAGAIFGLAQRTRRTPVKARARR